ncbi:unnamed protein product, partial [Hymenolepis diminuta]
RSNAFFISEDLTPDTATNNEAGKSALITSIKAKHWNLVIARCPKDARSFVCRIRKVNENNGDELAASGKRKEHCQRFADTLRTSELVRGVHGIIDENPGHIDI